MRICSTAYKFLRRFHVILFGRQSLRRQVASALAWCVRLEPLEGRVLLSSSPLDSSGFDVSSDLPVLLAGPAANQPPVLSVEQLVLVDVEREIDVDVDGLLEVVSVALSPDGRHVYTASALGDALAVFERDSISGALSFLEFHPNDPPDVDGLLQASSVVVSPDGLSVYVTSELDSAVAVFNRDPATGQVSFVEVHRDGDNDVDGIETAVSVTVSPDNAHVYVAGHTDDAIALFDRDFSTGELTFVGSFKDGADNIIDGLDGISDVVVSDDGAHLYATGSVDDAIAVFDRNLSTGVLTFVQIQKDEVGSDNGLNGASSVDVSSDGLHVYVTGYDDDALAVFSRDVVTGELTFVERQFEDVEGLDGASDVVVSGNGQDVYVTGFLGDALVWFRRDSSTGALTLQEVFKDGPGQVDGLNAANAVVVSDEGGHVYVVGRNDDALSVFSRVREVVTFTEAGGAVGLVSEQSQLTILDPDQTDLQSATVTMTNLQDDGKEFLSATTAGTNIVTQFDGTTLSLTGSDTVANYQQVLRTLSYNDTSRNPDSIDRVIHVTVNDGTDESSVFEVIVQLVTVNDPPVLSVDELSFTEIQQEDMDNVDGLRDVISVAVSGDGRHVYATGQFESALVVFSRNLVDGRLTFVDRYKNEDVGISGLSSASSVAVSPDGAFVYVTGGTSHTIAVFSREVSTGELAFLEVHENEIDGVKGLKTPVSVSVSPDGTNIYVAGRSDHALAVFSRDAATGHLAFVQVVKNGVDIGEGLMSVNSVAVSGDGLHVYAVGGNTLAVFRRNTVTGLVEFLRVHENDDADGGVDGLAGASFVTVSSDGRHVYVAGRNDNAVAVFNRDVATGSLSFLEARKDGLNNPVSVAVSDDGQYVYVTGEQPGNTLTIFRRDALTGSLTFIEVLRDSDDDIDGLARATGVALSPSGGHVYVAGRGDNALSVFSRMTDTFVFNESGGPVLIIAADDKFTIFDADHTELHSATVTISNLLDPGQEFLGVTTTNTNITSSFDGTALHLTGVDTVANYEQVLRTLTYDHTSESPDPTDRIVRMTVNDGTEEGDTFESVVQISIVNDPPVLSIAPLTMVENQANGAAGVDGLAGASSAILSPDGSYLYATGTDDDAVVVFARDHNTGQLTFIEVHKDGMIGIDGLAGAASVATDAMGEHIYVASFLDDAVAVFGRDEDTGRLTFIEVVKEGATA